MLSERLETRVKNGAGRIIWAYDPKLNEPNPFAKFKSIFNEIQDQITAVKINRQLVLPYGLRNKELLDILSMVQNADVPLIMDAKVNDIGYTNESIALNYFNAGFDALICNPFIGLSGGLEPIVSTAERLSKDLIFLVYMSHPGADFGYGRKIFLTKDEQQEIGKESCYYYELFAHLVNKLNASGCIVGATYPEKVSEIRSILKPEKLIISPGVGAQSGDAKKSRDAGMNYAIIGRAITEGSKVRQYLEKMSVELK